MEKIKILAIVGSLREKSFNRQLALAAKEMLKEEVEFEILEYKDVPLFNQDEEFPPPSSVERVRKEVMEADGIWFFTPEYNHFFSGVLKNLIDWLSRPIEGVEGRILSKKPAALSGISTGMGATTVAQDHLVTLLSLLNMDIMNIPRITIPYAVDLADEEGKLQLGENKSRLEKLAKAFIQHIENNKKAK